MEPLKKRNTPQLIKINGALNITCLSLPTYYRRVKDGLMPKPIKIGPRAVAWLESEIIAVTNALIAGCTENEIKALVQELHEARAEKFGGKHDVQ